MIVAKTTPTDQGVIIDFFDEDGDSVSICLSVEDASKFKEDLSVAIEEAKRLVPRTDNPTPGYAGEPTDINFGGSDF
mgnify:CR=1 FL=1|jgi:hypothetical protein